MHAELQGFTPVERTEVQVRLGQTVDLPLTMQIGALQEAIQVVSPTVDTTHMPPLAPRSTAPPFAPAGRAAVSATLSTSHRA